MASQKYGLHVIEDAPTGSGSSATGGYSEVADGVPMPVGGQDVTKTSPTTKQLAVDAVGNFVALMDLLRRFDERIDALTMEMREFRKVYCLATGQFFADLPGTKQE